jgi:DNA repair protein RadC
LPWLNRAITGAKASYGAGVTEIASTDLRMTRSIGAAANVIQIKMLDHVIIGAPADGRSGYFSFKEAGLL